MNSPDVSQESLLDGEQSLDQESSRVSTKDCVRKLSVAGQIRVLMVKNLRIFQRNWGFFVFHLVLIVVIFCWMALLTYLIKNKSALVQNQVFDPVPLTTFKRCGESTLDPTDNCLTLGVVYVESGDKNPELEDWISRAKYHVEQRFSLKENVDTKVIYRGNSMAGLYDEMQKYSGILNMVTFCNDLEIVNNPSITLNCGKIDTDENSLDINVYGIHYNSTRLVPNSLRDSGTPIQADTNSILLKMAIDEAIINYYREEAHTSSYFSLPFNPVRTCSRSLPKTVRKVKRGSFLNANEIKSQLAESSGEGFEYDLQTMDYPKPKNRFIEKLDATNQWGSFFYIFVILLSFVKFAQLIAREKQQQLRKGLIPLGLNHFAYWFSWLACICSLDVILTFFMALMGFLLGFPLFNEIPIILPVLVFLFCLWSYRLLAVLVVTFCDNYRSATKMNYLVLIVSIFLQRKSNPQCSFATRAYPVCFGCLPRRPSFPFSTRSSFSSPRMLFQSSSTTCS